MLVLWYPKRVGKTTGFIWGVHRPFDPLNGGGSQHVRDHLLTSVFVAAWWVARWPSLTGRGRRDGSPAHQLMRLSVRSIPTTHSATTSLALMPLREKRTWCLTRLCPGKPIQVCTLKASFERCRFLLFRTIAIRRLFPNNMVCCGICLTDLCPEEVWKN